VVKAIKFIREIFKQPGVVCVLIVIGLGENMAIVKGWQRNDLTRRRFVKSIMDEIVKNGRINIFRNPDERQSAIGAAILFTGRDDIYHIEYKEGTLCPMFFGAVVGDNKTLATLESDIEYIWDNYIQVDKEKNVLPIAVHSSSYSGLSETEKSALLSADKIQTSIFDRVGSIIRRCESVAELILRGLLVLMDDRSSNVGMMIRSTRGGDEVENITKFIISKYNDYFAPMIRKKTITLGSKPPQILVKNATDEEIQYEATKQVVSGIIYDMLPYLNNIVVYRQYHHIREKLPSKEVLDELSEISKQYHNIEFVGHGIVPPSMIPVEQLVDKLKYDAAIDVIEIDEKRWADKNLTKEEKQKLIDHVSSHVKLYRKHFYNIPHNIIRTINGWRRQLLIERSKKYNIPLHDLLGAIDKKLPELKGRNNLYDILNNLQDYMKDDEKLSMSQSELMDVIDDDYRRCVEYYDPDAISSSPIINFRDTELWTSEHINTFRKMIYNDLVSVFGDEDSIPDSLRNLYKEFLVQDGRYTYKSASVNRKMATYRHTGEVEKEIEEPFENYAANVSSILDVIAKRANAHYDKRLLITLYELVSMEDIGKLVEDVKLRDKFASFADLVTKSMSMTDEDLYYKINDIFSWTHRCLDKRNETNAVETIIRGNSKNINDIRKEIILRAEHDRLLRIKNAPVNEQIVYIYGETGTGKEEIANALHMLSRPNKPFVKVNCGGLPNDEAMASSMLFGHVKGAFTGAIGDTIGYFGMAKDGDLFLDEIQDIQPIPLRLLKTAIWDGKYRKFGSMESDKKKLDIPIECRIIVASNRHLMDLDTAPDAFRQVPDFAARLSPPIEVKPLAERPEDIRPLIEKFVEEVNKYYDEELDISPYSIDLIERMVKIRERPDNARLIRRFIQLGKIQSSLHGRNTIWPQDLVKFTEQTKSSFIIKLLLRSVIVQVNDWAKKHVEIMQKENVSNDKIEDIIKFYQTNDGASIAVSDKIYRELSSKQQKNIVELINDKDRHLFTIILRNLIDDYEKQPPVAKKHKNDIEALRFRINKYLNDNLKTARIDPKEAASIKKAWSEIIKAHGHYLLAVADANNVDLYGADDDELIADVMSKYVPFKKALGVNIQNKSHIEFITEISTSFIPPSTSAAVIDDIIKDVIKRIKQWLPEFKEELEENEITDVNKFINYCTNSKNIEFVSRKIGNNMSQTLRQIIQQTGGESLELYGAILKELISEFKKPSRTEMDDKEILYDLKIRLNKFFNTYIPHVTPPPSAIEVAKFRKIWSEVIETHLPRIMLHARAGGIDLTDISDAELFTDVLLTYKPFINVIGRDIKSKDYPEFLMDVIVNSEGILKENKNDNAPPSDDMLFVEVRKCISSDKPNTLLDKEIIDEFYTDLGDFNKDIIEIAKEL